MCVGASLRQQSRYAGANGAEGVRKFVADLLRHNLAAKSGNEGCWSDVAQQSADEQVPLSIIGPNYRVAPALMGTIPSLPSRDH